MSLSFINMMKSGPHSYLKLIVILAIIFPHMVSAAWVYRQDFDTFDDIVNNYIYFDASPGYDAIPGADVGGSLVANADLNGLIATSASSIASAQSGTHFLYSNTAASNVVGTVWGTDSSQIVSVVVGETYEFSFWMAGNIATNPALIVPSINGVDLRGLTVDGFTNPSTATYSSTVWNKFTYRWLADSTVADLSLYNARTGGMGNDFGIDTIELTPVPVPEASGALLVCVTGLLAIFRRRRGMISSGKGMLED